MIKTHFGSKVSSAVNADIPRFLVPTHQIPHFKCFDDSEASKSSVKICFKTPVNESLMTVKDYKNRVVESMFHEAMKRRFDKVSDKIDRPYFLFRMEAGLFAKPVKVHVLTSECKEDGIILALEVMLTEVDATLEEIQRLQDEGPLIEELEAALEIDRRESETDLQKNGWWHERILASYQSRIYSGDVGVSLDDDENTYLTFINNLTPEVARTALRKMIPFPCKNWYTLVTLMPEENSVEDSE